MRRSLRFAYSRTAMTINSFKTRGGPVGGRQELLGHSLEVLAKSHPASGSSRFRSACCWRTSPTETEGWDGATIGF